MLKLRFGQEGMSMEVSGDKDSISYLYMELIGFGLCDWAEMLDQNGKVLERYDEEEQPVPLWIKFSDQLENHLGKDVAIHKEFGVVASEDSLDKLLDLIRLRNDYKELLLHRVPG
jgi:hypothetical protein